MADQAWPPWVRGLLNQYGEIGVSTTTIYVPQPVLDVIAGGMENDRIARARLKDAPSPAPPTVP